MESFSTARQSFLRNKKCESFSDTGAPPLECLKKDSPKTGSPKTYRVKPPELFILENLTVIIRIFDTLFKVDEKLAGIVDSADQEPDR